MATSIEAGCALPHPIRVSPNSLAFARAAEHSRTVAALRAFLLLRLIEGIFSEVVVWLR